MSPSTNTSVCLRRQCLEAVLLTGVLSDKRTLCEENTVAVKLLHLIHLGPMLQAELHRLSLGYLASLN